MVSTRLIIVDDHELARRGLRSVLISNPDLEVLWEAADGEEAVEKSRDLHPDIVLLDISLPGISGIEAARQIREVSPASRIVFVSQHDSVRLAKDAIGSGACCYVVKSDAGLDLLTAIEAARSGRVFVSRTLVARGWS